MAGNAFIKFAGVATGESLQENFPGSAGWIEIGDWSWDIEAESSFLKGGGAAVGKAQPGALSFSHFFDKSSAPIMRNIVKGVHFATVDIVMCKQTGQDLPTEYFRIIMKQAFTTKVSTKGGEDGSVNQDVEMVCKDIQVEYKAQKNDGTLEQAPIIFQWDIAGNKVLQ